MKRRVTLGTLSLAAAAALTLGCGGKDSPTAPEVGSVTLSTSAATLVPTATLSLSATVKDVGGNSLSSSVAWTSSDQSHASVSTAGIVTGVSVGTATITATAGGQSASALVTVKEGAVIGVNGGTVTALGGAVTLTVPHGAVASNVQITVEPAANPTASPRLVAGTAIELGPSGQSFAAPVQLSIRYAPTQLPGGASEQLLRINREAGGSWQPVIGSTADVTAKVVTASLTSFSIYSVLSSPITGVSVAPDRVTLEQGATQQLVATARDDANVTVTDLVVDWKSGNTAIATVSANGLVTAVAPGPVDITATANGRSATTSVTVTARPVIGIPASRFDFAAAVGGADPADQVIDITNAGGGTLEGLTATSDVSWLTATLAESAAPTKLTLHAGTGVLLPGLYTATVTLASTHPGVASRTITVVFTLTQPGVRLSASSVQFSALVGGPDPNGQQLSVTSATGAPISGLSANVFCPAQGPCGWLRAVLDATTTPTQLTLQALSGSLPAGTYTTTVTVSSSQQGIASATLAVTFVVGSGQSIVLSATTASFTGTTGGANPGAQSIAVTNGGSGTLPGLTSQVTYGAGEPTGWLSATLNQTTAPATLTITPNTAGLASGAHTATVTVSSTLSDAAPRTVSVTLTLLSPSIIITTGNNQAAMAGTAVPAAPSVLVRDGLGLPMAGLSVTFAVTGGNGAVTSPAATTNVSGTASSGWVLGAIANPNALSATVTGPGFGPANNSVVFSATGCEGGGSTSSYAITVCFVTSMSPTQRSAFEDAAARWGTLITSDLSDVPVALGEGACGAGSPSLNMTIDDLVIFARIEPIDGVNGILGAAGPCFIRNSNHLTLLGLMRFDIEDVASLEAKDQLRSVIQHEMGHVLGIGSLWQIFGLLKNPSTAGSPPLDTYFSGLNAIEGFNAIGGSTYTGGQKVPVENMFSSGTINGHWRESVFANELMTGFINKGSNPLSVVTVRSLADLGYTVNANGADPFQLTLSLQALSATVSSQRAYGDDVIRGPLHTIDARGRIVRIR
jgi:uncharacterized protein YjdB